jgi:hypothetical protein
MSCLSRPPACSWPTLRRDLTLSSANLHDELQMVDMQLSKLEDLRTSIVHRMIAQLPVDTRSSNLLPFPRPSAITERSSLPSEWPIGTRPTEMP